MITHDGFAYAVVVPRVRLLSDWHDRYRMQAWCLANIGPAESNLWNPGVPDVWRFQRLEDAVLFQLTWCGDAA